jgi:hypothetical protein
MDDVAFFLFFFLFVVGGLGLMIWALVDALRMPDDASFKTGTQLVWVLVILLAQGIGAIIYFIIGRPRGGASEARKRATMPPTVPPPPSGSV